MCSKFASDRAAARRDGRILLLGHLDTVWPLGTLKTMPCRVGDGRLWGPGTLDMKAGVAMALTAIEMLAEADLLDREIVLLLNSDEEIGSPVSRPITERLAQECSAVYVLEPAQGLAYKTARKGTGNWRIDIKGVAAHAGVDFEKGASALRELAHVIEKVSGWTELKRGLTVSVGLAGGGTKTNVIPAQAWAEVDVRIARKADGPRIERKFAAPQGGRPALHACRDRRHQPAADGAYRAARSTLSPGPGAGWRTRIRAGGSLHRRRFRWKLHRCAGSSHARRPGRRGRRRARGA